MFRSLSDLKIDLSDLASSIVGIDRCLVEPGKYRAIVSKRMQLNSLCPEIEASVRVKLVSHEAVDAFLESIIKYKYAQNKTKDDQQRDARRERSRKNSLEYRSPPKPSRASHRAENGRGRSEQSASWR